MNMKVNQSTQPSGTQNNQAKKPSSQKRSRSVLNQRLGLNSSAIALNVRTFIRGRLQHRHSIDLSKTDFKDYSSVFLGRMHATILEIGLKMGYTSWKLEDMPEFFKIICQDTRKNFKYKEKCESENTTRYFRSKMSKAAQAAGDDESEVEETPTAFVGAVDRDMMLSRKAKAKLKTNKSATKPSSSKVTSGKGLEVLSDVDELFDSYSALETTVSVSQSPVQMKSRKEKAPEKQVNCPTTVHKSNKSKQ